MELLRRRNAEILPLVLGELVEILQKLRIELRPTGDTRGLLRAIAGLLPLKARLLPAITGLLPLKARLLPAITGLLTLKTGRLTSIPRLLPTVTGLLTLKARWLARIPRLLSAITGLLTNETRRLLAECAAAGQLLYLTEPTAALLRLTEGVLRRRRPDGGGR